MNDAAESVTPASPAPARSVLVPAPARARVETAITAARDWLLARQHADGYWLAELEGDTTLESYIILIEAFFGRRDSEKVRALARVIAGEALPGGGWHQYLGGPPDLSVSCLSYFALKVAGEPADAPHMRAARAVIKSLGGVGRSNTYTRTHLAMFGQLPWDSVPAVPPEMMFAPQTAPFSVYDMSSWSRTIFVPLSIIWAKKPVIPLPPACGVAELLVDADALKTPEPPRRAIALTKLGFAERSRRGRDGEPSQGSPLNWKTLFGAVDRLLKVGERLPGAGTLRRVALERAGHWMIERLAESDGLSAILPAMANSTLALKLLGYDESHPLLAESLRHLNDLCIADGEGIRVQPCISPVWDTVLAAHALFQCGTPAGDPALVRAVSWLIAKQTRAPGDWAVRNPAPPGGWYFEMRNEFYPDVDDTCMALMVLAQARARGSDPAREGAIARGLDWMLGMQNDDGGWASFDRGNDKDWLTHVPFADHNAMIDPSTADITSRVLESLSTLGGFGPGHPVVQRAIGFLKRDQSTDGAWYGRWGVNYVYGTWQVLRGLAAIGEQMDAVYVRRAVRWFLDHQNADGGWGESIASYDDPSQRGRGASTPSQTAWAIMGLCAAGEAGSPAVRRAVGWLLERQQAGTWEQIPWTGTGFPKVFYLNYHFYRHYFPLMALGQYAAAVNRPAAR